MREHRLAGTPNFSVALSEKMPQKPFSPNLNACQADGKRFDKADQAEVTNRPLVSVITAVYNAEQYLAECLESVLNQDYPCVEHIIIDGGSRDGTLSILERYSHRIAFWKSEPDKGIYDAWNKGLKAARGEWICFLGADDELLPYAISSYMALAELNSNVEFLSSRIRIVYQQGFEKIAGEPWTWSQFARFMCAAHVGSMHRRSLFERYGIFDTSYKSAADYEFLLRARGELKAAFTPAVTATMRAGGVSASRQALREKAKAKIVTGGRGRILTSIELAFDDMQYMVRPLLYRLRRIAARNRRDAAK
jgi:glycosyltransferase involved in cell wall biosynthesis